MAMLTFPMTEHTGQKILTEETGRRILAELQHMSNVLEKGFNINNEDTRSDSRASLKK